MLQQLAQQNDLSLLDRYLLPTDSAVASLTTLELTAEQTRAVGFGQRVKFDNPQRIEGQVRLFSPEHQFLGVAEIGADNVIRPLRMVNL